MTTLSRHDDGLPCWIDVMVETDDQHHDLRAFLSTLFDWTWELGVPETGHYAIASSNGAAVMGVGRAEGARGVATTYFSTSNINDSVARAVELGATTLMPVMEVMALGTMAMVLDPSGAPFGLWQPGTFHGFGVVNEIDAPGWFDHVSSDPESDGTFYSELSGHQLSTLEGDMRILQKGEQWYASISHAQNGEPASWKPIFVVDSLERIHETVPRHGGAILLAEMPVPGSAICVFTEPVNGTSMTVMRGGEHPAA